MIKIPLIGIFLLVIGFLGLKVTENGVFTVISVQEDGLVEEATYKHFLFAQIKMDSLDDTQAYIQREDKKVVALSEGLVNLHTKDVSENTLYTVDGSDEQGYVNGSYGGDALYLNTSMDGTQVLMQISGVKGWVSVEDIELYLFDPGLYPSSYSISNGLLIHTISTDLHQGVVNSITIGLAPEGLEEGTTYYSYDGNYFYTDPSLMKEDVLNEEYEHAVNQTPYYNFYQYVPHRSSTNLTSDDFNTFLEEYGITQTASGYPCSDDQSALYDLGDTFLDVQKEVGINGAMMFATAVNESGYGQSQYALEDYNLFGHAAYDSNPDNATTYSSYQDCIQQHAYGFLQNGYANLLDDRYHGSWFGNKASGVNVSYASDPYWGEKAAHFYLQLDAADDYIDHDSIEIKTVKVNDPINVYADADQSTILYTYEKGDIASFVILKEEDGHYQVASECPIQDGQIQPQNSYNNSVGYVAKANLK